MTLTTKMKNSQPIHLVTIIAGSRCTQDIKLLDMAMEILIRQDLVPQAVVIEVISGTARGADQLGETWAKRHNVFCRKMPADWSRHKRKAGFLRNKDMIDAAQEASRMALQNKCGPMVQGSLVALWDGASRGTAHTISMALDRGLRTVVALLEPDIDLGASPLRDKHLSMLWHGRTHRSTTVEKPERFKTKPKGAVFLLGENVHFSESIQIIL